MPVVVDRGRDGHEIIAARGCDCIASTPPLRDGGCIEIGIVNNMPDSALEATELQFLNLLAAAVGHDWCRVRFFSLPDVPRTPRGRELIAGYAGIERLCDSGLDALIVTGTEPIASDLREEPYWTAFTELVDWAAHHTISTIWSCLASHVAVLHLDGIVRTPLPKKCFGVFAADVTAGSPFTADMPSRLRIPHARLNGLCEQALAAKGYDIITRSREAGVDMFVRNSGRSAFLFLQGHPEYGVHSLLLEYRRDVGRFLRREREIYPPMPRHYFDRDTEDALAVFERRARTERSDTLLDSFPASTSDTNASHPWLPSAVGIYRNWLAYLAGRSGRRLERVPVAPAEAQALIVAS